MTDEEMTYFYADIEAGCPGINIGMENEKLKEENDKLKEEVETLNFTIKDFKYEIDQFEKINKCQANFITKLKEDVNHYKDLIEHRTEVSIINHNLYSDLECERDELLEEIKQLKATISKMETINKEVK